jgi:hypothetical protein
MRESEKEQRMIELNDDQKVQALLAQLTERYNASHQIRDRSTQFTLWISGLAIGLAWVLISESVLVLSQRIALTLLISAIGGGAAYFIIALKRGFQTNRKMMIRVEDALGMHTAGVFLANEPLLSPQYRQTRARWSDHFNTLFVWIVVVAAALLVLTWSRALVHAGGSPDHKPKTIIGETTNG